jgi:hypothetical protein
MLGSLRFALSLFLFLRFGAGRGGMDWIRGEDFISRLLSQADGTIQAQRGGKWLIAREILFAGLRHPLY